ncbi:MAG: type I restriction enzyme HsdR N-terminal domain-containing protein [Desulfuromonadaceae bacterium]|nr:type I restriction enzyme HsdR N-terminal domain-containing protein [Desulfuromonadaceae bacterium]MDD2847632.1 type I restriction enzyme HsdR N-terminal domain-containing protein [Desulfuromonadaceae bacterium]MDD4131122.1 type I restriction enzyme HsdR N-terminal domain-containing protein [Desulfuromonadaceae bacterium]
MEQEAIREIWSELCFHLSDNIKPNINESAFEHKVLHSLEKLGWSEFRGELKVRPYIQIGRQGQIIPDIVVYTPDNKAVVVLEIKRPAEDLSRTGCIGQLQSYMRQTKADFGLLVGKDIYVYYDGVQNPQADPLLLSKFSFKSDSAEGVEFVNLFNRDSFIAGKYESYLKAHIDRLDLERRTNVIREQLQSDKINNKILKFLQDEFRNEDTLVLVEAMKGLTVKLSYHQYSVNKKYLTSDASKLAEPVQTVFVCRNKASGKHFILIDDLNDNDVLLISPEGVQIALRADLFDQPKDESLDYLLSYKLITAKQLEKYKEYESQQSCDETSIKEDLNQVKVKKPRPAALTAGHKNPSPPPDEWIKSIPELSKISNLNSWRSICNYLNVHVGANSARRALQAWIIKNRNNWPTIPEP